MLQGVTSEFVSEIVDFSCTVRFSKIRQEFLRSFAKIPDFLLGFRPS